MKLFKTLFIFTLIVTAAACTDIASNNHIASGEGQGTSNENVSVNTPGNKKKEATPEPTAAGEESKKPAPDTPDGLVAELYKQHDNENSPFFQSEDRSKVDRYFAKALADMIWNDASVAKDKEVGALDFDPLYNAQDTEVTNFKVGKPDIKGDKATVNVTLDNFDEPQTIKFLLVRENGAWKIEDIDYGEDTLTKIFKENLK